MSEPPERLRRLIEAPPPSDPALRRFVDALTKLPSPVPFEGARAARVWTRVRGASPRRRRPWELAALLTVGGVCLAAVYLSRAGGERRAPVTGLARPTPPRTPMSHAAALPVVGPGLASSDGCATPYLDPRHQTLLGPVDRSHWVQPWRAHSDTWPAMRIRAAASMYVEHGSEALGRARLLAASGLKHAYTYFLATWMKYDDPSACAPEGAARFRNTITALRETGLRPLVHLDFMRAHPGPLRRHTLDLAAPARKGARTIRLTSTAGVVPGRTGLDALTGDRAPELFVTAVSPEGTATLSKPLPVDLAAGAHRASTLRLLPFHRPRRPDGSPRPEFEETLAGWLAYVRTAVTETRTALGSSLFDVEIWNEILTHGDFLDIDTYYDPPIDDGPGAAGDVTVREILARTVAMLRDPANGFGDIRIGNGFANTRWDEAASQAIAGVTALDRRFSVRGLRFPGAETGFSGRSIDATGAPNGVFDGRNTAEVFTPTYDALFPEIVLTAILPLEWWRSGQVFRDLSPLPSVNAKGHVHGRGVAAAAPDLEVWITGMNVVLDAARRWGNVRSDAEALSIQAKSTLRALAANVGAGATMVAFYAPDAPDVTLVDRRAPDGGPVMVALRRFLGAFAGPALIASRRALVLTGVGYCGQRVQFQGDGTAARPALSNRDVVAFFPFQTHDDRLVAATYVMTRDVSAVLPPETYTLTVGGVEGTRAVVRVRDPITGADVATRVVGRRDNELELEVPLVDYPRLLEIALR